MYLAGFAFLEGTFALYTYTRGEGFLYYPCKCDWMGSKVAENLFDNKEDKFLTNFLDIHLHADSCLHYCLQTQVYFGVCFVFMAKLFFPLYFLQSIFQFVEKVLRGKKTAKPWSVYTNHCPTRNFLRVKLTRRALLFSFINAFVWHTKLPSAKYVSQEGQLVDQINKKF